jgi:hypothetical protein
MKRYYITLSASALGSLLRTDIYQGKSYLVCPVISAVGDKVIYPANAPYPEYVPAEVLSIATESRNFRPVVMNHPVDDSGQYCSANSPGILEKYQYGFVFNARFEDGKVKSEIWLDEVRADEIGGDAPRTIERLKSGEVVEVSEGSYVIVDEQEGIHNGDEYSGVWSLCVPDHLATLSEGIEGACSVNKHGCGANRVNRGNGMRNGTEGKGASMRFAALSQARRPTFTGTESSSWSVPTFSEYIRYLNPGSDGPKSVSQCSSELKTRIANHSLLGDPSANSTSGLTTLPCVNPSNGKLNEKALLAIINGKNIPDDLPESALKSAQDMAQRLINSEFSSLGVANMKNKNNGRGGVLSRFLSMFRDSMSNNRLYTKLTSELQEIEPGFLSVDDYDLESKTVVYSTMIRFGSEYDYSAKTEYYLWQRTFSVTDENVTINDDPIAVEWNQVYTPVTENPEPEAGLEVSHVNTINEAEPCSCKGGHEMEFNRDNAVSKLIASKKFTPAQKDYLRKLDDSVLKYMEESLPKPVTNGDPSENKSADHGDKTIIENTPGDKKVMEPDANVPPPNPTDDKTTDRVLLSKSQYEDLLAMKPAADAFRAQQEQTKSTLVKVLSSHQTEYTEPELKAMDVPNLQRLCKVLKVDIAPSQTTVADYSFARGVGINLDENKAPQMPSVTEKIRAARAAK